MSWLRPAGIISFILVALAIALFWWFAAGWIIKTAIEEVGTRAVGAQVDLDSAQVSFSPFGVRLAGLQVTNPDSPMENLVAIDEIQSHVNSIKALMGQAILDDLGATGVRFNSPRKTSGEITKKAATDGNDKDSDSMLPFELNAVKDKLPSVDDILAKEPLTTLNKATELRTTAKQKQDAINASVAELPTAEKLKDYEARIKQITSEKIESIDELQKRKQELDALKSDIRNDKQAIEKTRDELRDAKTNLGALYTELKNAPKEDIARILQRYGLDASGAANITQLIFGDKAKEWLSTAQTWYARLADFMPEGGGDAAPKKTAPPRGTGRFVHFPTQNPTPDFLVRKARLGIELPLGNFDVQIADATHQPNILGRPMTLLANAEKLSNANSINIDGVFDHVKPNDPSDNLKWRIDGWKLADVALSKSSALPLQLQRASVNVNGNLALKGPSLDGDVVAKFANAQWQSEAKDGWASQVAKTLATIDNFALNGKVQGKLSAPSISVSSDLDKQIKNAAVSQLKSKQGEFEQKLNARLAQEVEQSAGPYKDQLAALTQTEGSLDERINQIEAMLKTEMQSAVDSKKQEAEQKLKDKLKGLKF